MRLANVPKALGRARSLPLRRLLDTAARRGWATARGALQVWDAERLGLRDDGATALARVVPGVHDTAEALARLRAFGGRLPVSRAQAPALKTSQPDACAALLARADAACRGEWSLLGYPTAALGPCPDWQADFVHGLRWDETLASARQPIFRPEGPADIKIPWELSRLQHLPAVALAFAVTDDPRYLDLVVAQLGDWIAKNPPGLGVNWTNAMEVALRAISVSWAFELCRADPRFPMVLAAQVYWSLFAHGHFIRGHLEDGGVSIGNHYVADLLGLIWLGSLYPALQGADGWRALAVGLLGDHLAIQVRADGGDEESSLAYHRLVAEMLGLACAILGANGRDEPLLRKTLQAMAHFTRGVSQPDGRVPQVGDNDGGRALQLLARAPLDHRGLVSWAALLTEDPELAAQGPLDAEAALLVGSDAAERHAKLAATVEATESGLTIFPDSGLAAFRRGDLYCLCAATPVGQEGAGGHGHNDKLGFTLWFGGDLIVDPGSYAYTCDPAARNAFRATAAHATLQVDAREQDPTSSDLFSLPETAHARVLRCETLLRGFVWEAEHRGFAPIVHRRELRLEGDTLTVTDELVGPGRALHEVAVRFPLAPGLRAEHRGRNVVVRREEQVIAELSATSPEGIAWSLDEGWYSPNYGARVPTTVLRAHATHRLPVIVRTAIRLAVG